jgi:amino acid transporter
MPFSWSALKRGLLGSPLASSRERHERLNIPLALAIFASDALSSTAYATEEILVALVGTAFAVHANLLSLPIALLITLLMIIVVISYRQVIFAYPQGGGSFEVSKENLGPVASQVAGAALLIDYVLTVAVSVCAGVSAITSLQLTERAFNIPDKQFQVPLALIFIGLITLVNLRGVKESGKVLAFPAFGFIGIMMALIGWGVVKLATGHDEPMMLSAATTPWPAPAASLLPDNFEAMIGFPLMLVLLKAFSHGCAALTGIEVIANGVKAFEEPAPQNANKTLVLMAAILGLIFVGMTALAFGFHIVPSHDQTVISMVGRAVFGEGNPLYYALQVITMIILVLAANTSFAGFPRLANILADAGYLPRQLMSLGDRLVFTNGIVFLGIVSALMVWAYNADTHAMIPLYAVGVFLSFSLAQWGMVAHHKKHQQPHWQRGMVINGFGAATTAIVTLILVLEKFSEGAWIVVVTIPMLVYIFRSVKRHYETIARQLVLPPGGYVPQPIEHTVLVLVSSLNRGTIPALEYAKTISTRVEAVHVELKPEATKRLIDAWDAWGCGVPLTILKSPYRSITQPLLDYVDEVEERHDHDLVTVIVPEFVTKKFWHNVLHNQTSLLIKTLLRFKKGKVVTSIRYYLEE